jgi:hypothetical protein
MICAQIPYGDSPYYTLYSNGDPPPAFATTSTETIDFSIGFGFTVLIYIPLDLI